MIVLPEKEVVGQKTLWGCCCAERHTRPIVLSLQLQLNYSSDILLHSPTAFQSRNIAGICQIRIESRARLGEGGQEQKNPIVSLLNLFTRLGKVSECSGKFIPAAVLQLGRCSTGWGETTKWESQLRGRENPFRVPSSVPSSFSQQGFSPARGRAWAEWAERIRRSLSKGNI